MRTSLSSVRAPLPFLCACSLALTLPCLSSCSGTADGRTAGESSAAAAVVDRETGEAVPAERTAAAKPTAPQNQGSVAEQRRRFLIREQMKKARRAYELKLWDDVVKAAASVLQLDPSQEEARDLLRRAQTMLGERTPSVSEFAGEVHLRAEIEKQRDLLLAREYENKGDLALTQKHYDDAIENYERALLTLRYSPWFTPGSSDEARIKAKKTQAAKDKETYERRLREHAAAEARRKLREEERKERIRRRVRVKYLFEQANLAFQAQQYGKSVSYLDEALAIDPLNRDAKELRRLAMRARHDQSLDEIHRRWRREWAATFEDLERSDITQVDVIKHDLEHWRKVATRRPLEFESVKVEPEPETEAILRKLDETVIDHSFSDTSLDDWVDYYRRATGLNFVVSPKVVELGEDETSLNLKLGRKSVRKALDLIARVKPLQWTVRDGVVQILSKEERVGKLIPRMYDVREIINPITHHPGKDLILRAGEEEAAEEEETEELPVVVDLDTLQNLIRSNVDPASWDVEGAQITPTGNALVITQTPEVHKKIEALLADLRANSGIQVDIEARFLRVEDNFLEEIGVDFRGLGNQASTGKPGMGLQKQGNRAGFGFDDFGRNVSASEPGVIGTGFEPGIFYDDGFDGDLFARTENLFDRALGGGPEGLTNAGGLSFQWTYLDDTELEVILRSVAKKERVEQIAAPRLLVHNMARANLEVNRQFTYIRDFNVEIAQSAAVADPVVGVVRDGVVLDVRPVVSADRKYILMELRPTVATLALPIPTFSTTLGVGQPVSIQVPRLTIQKVRTTVTMPDDGKLLLGGMKSVENQDFESGIPILKDIPGLSFLFSRKGTFHANKKILILLRAKIVIPSEYEPDLGR